MERNSFVYYRSFWEAMKDLPKDVVYEVDQALKEYALNGVELDDMKPMAKALFCAFKPQIDANNKKFENGCKGGKFGKLGGRPKKEISEDENPKETPKKPLKNPKKTPNEPQENPKETPNVNDIKEDDKSSSVCVNNNNIFTDKDVPPLPPPPPPSVPKPQTRFVPPTIDDVRAYINEKGYTFTAEAFVGFYESNGWMVGKNKMKSWHGACTTWQNRRNEETKKADEQNPLIIRNKRYTQYIPNGYELNKQPSDPDGEGVLW